MAFWWLPSCLQEQSSLSFLQVLPKLACEYLPSTGTHYHGHDESFDSSKDNAIIPLTDTWDNYFSRIFSFSGTSISPQHSWRQFAKWTEEYGEIFTIRLGFGNKLLFVLGNASSAHAILEKQASVTADRPRLIMSGELISNNMRILFIKHSDRWRSYRKVMHETLQAKDYEGIQKRESVITVQQIGSQPSRFQDHFHRYAASLIMTITYDQAVTSLEDKRVQAVQERVGAVLTWARPGKSPLDAYPFLLYLPDFINPWKREGKRLHQLELDLFLGEYRQVKQRLSDGSSNAASFSSKLMDKQKELGLSDEEACYLAGSLFGAGSDTTASAVSREDFSRSGLRKASQSDCSSSKH